MYRPQNFNTIRTLPDEAVNEWFISILWNLQLSPSSEYSVSVGTCNNEYLLYVTWSFHGEKIQ